MSATIHLANRDWAALIDDFVALNFLPPDCDRWLAGLLELWGLARVAPAAASRSEPSAAVTQRLSVIASSLAAALCRRACPHPLLQMPPFPLPGV